MKQLTVSLILTLAVVAGILGGGGVAFAQTTHELIETAIDQLENDITVEPENRCAPYDPKDYRYNSLELKYALIAYREKEIRDFYTEGKIIRADREQAIGVIQSFYTDETFFSLDEADLDHLVALSEAHDSGACAWSSKEKRDFTNDPENHELARPRLNREEKQGKDWAEWQPPLNSANYKNWCFAALRIVDTKWRYGLTVDQAEYDALAESLARCRDVAAGWD